MRVIGESASPVTDAPGLPVLAPDVSTTGRLFQPYVAIPTGSWPEAVAIGDVNGDGLNDVVVAIGTGIGVLTQNVDGTLNPMVLYSTNDSLRVRVADLNGDGRLDIVSLGWGTNTVTVFAQNEDGTLAAPVLYSAPHAGYDDLDVGDVNNDGLTDVIVMSGQGLVPNISILYQESDGTLGDLTSLNVATPHQNTSGIGVGDVNGDGLNDIVSS